MTKNKFTIKEIVKIFTQRANQQTVRQQALWPDFFSVNNWDFEDVKAVGAAVTIRWRSDKADVLR